jgi:hypothetical protein
MSRFSPNSWWSSRRFKQQREILAASSGSKASRPRVERCTNQNTVKFAAKQVRTDPLQQIYILAHPAAPSTDFLFSSCSTSEFTPPPNNSITTTSDTNHHHQQYFIESLFSRRSSLGFPRKPQIPTLMLIFIPDNLE